jgi:hypothetical protein
MIGEMYVVQLIQLSEKARTVAAEVLGEFDEARLLKKVAAEDGLRELSKHWNSEEAFEQLALRIKAALENPILPRLTPNHLRKLDSPQLRLAHILGCDADEVAQHLLDSAAVRRTFQNVYGKSADAPSDIRILLFTIAGEPFARRLEQRYPMDDFGTIVSRERWLLPAASTALAQHAAADGVETRDLTRVLARLLEQEHPPVSAIRTSQGLLDSYAVIWLQQRLLHLAARLKLQSVEHIQEAVQLAPHRKCLRDLQARLELFETGSVARVLPHFITQTVPLSYLLHRNNYEVMPLKAKPVPGLNLMVREARTYPKRILLGLSTQTVGAFELFCPIEGEDEPKLVLRCTDLPLETYEHLTAALRMLNGDSLSPIGDHLGERLLNTLVLKPERFLRLLSEGVQMLGPAFIQALVLTESLTVALRVPWQEDLAENLPFSVPESDRDVEFPLDIHGVVKRLKEEIGAVVSS